MQKADSKAKAVSQASLGQIMADRLDAWMMTKGKAFVGDTAHRVVSGISEQVAGLVEAQERMERRLDKVGTGLSEVRERLAEMAVREKTRDDALIQRFNEL